MDTQSKQRDPGEIALFVRAARSTDQPLITQLVWSERLIPLDLAWPQFLVAESHKQVVGIGQIKTHYDGSMELASLVVLPTHRRQGIARQLVHALIAKADRSIYLICPDHMERYYQRFGFGRASVQELSFYFLGIHLIAQIVGMIRMYQRNPRAVLIMRHPGIM